MDGASDDATSDVVDGDHVDAVVDFGEGLQLQAAFEVAD